MILTLINSIIVLAFFGNTLFHYNIIPRYFAVLSEMLILLLFFSAFFSSIIKKKVFCFNYALFFWFLSVCLISNGVNNYWSFDIVYSLRILFRFYIFYTAIINLDLTEKQIKKINMFFIICLSLQLPVVAYKFTIYGVSELTMGAYAVREGSLTTMLPVVVLLFAVSFYYIYNRNPLLIFMCIGFIGFAIVGKKRAILFFFPMTIFVLYYLIALKDKHIQVSKKILGSYLVGFITAVTIITIIIVNPTLNPENETGKGSINISFIASYTKNYTTRIDGEGYTTGRISTTCRIIDKMLDKDILNILFGMGPGMFTPSIFDPTKKSRISALIDKEFKVKYGFTPLTSILIEYGFFGVLIYITIIVKLLLLCRKYYNFESPPYWKAFATGAYSFSIFMLLFFCFYHPPAILGDTFPLIYFYTMGIVFYRYRVQTK